MPSIFLTQAERSRFEQLPELEPEDVRRAFYLTEADIQFVSTFYGPVNRVGIAIQLLLIRFLGFLPEDWQSQLVWEAVSFILLQLSLTD